MAPRRPPPAAPAALLLPAGERLLAAWAEIERVGETPVALLTGDEPAEPFRHYPDGDVYDFATHAQFYYHAHRAAEHGHVHLFLRPKGMPPGLMPAVAGADADAPCHLVAVGFGPDGWPAELFTTNRWVTGEAWYAAAAVTAMLPRLRLSTRGPLAPVARLVTELVAFYRPAIERLVEARDARIAAWSRAHPESEPLDDPGLEITSRVAIDPVAEIGALRP